MATTTIAASDYFAIVDASTSDNTLTLPPGRAHWLYHRGIDSSGTTATDTIFFHQSSGVAAANTAAVGKFPLQMGYSVRVPAGIVTLYYRTAANAPQFAIIGEELDFGVH